MPPLIERNQAGQRQDIADIVANIVSEKTPCTSTLRKESRPNQKKMDYQVETYPDASFDGVMDNADVSSFDSVPREEVTAIQQLFRRPWRVSRFADVTQVAGVPKGERGRQRTKALIILKFMVESRILCDADCTVDNGTDTPNRTRGAFHWMQTTAQSLFPVPASFRPAANVRYTGALGSLTEDAFRQRLDRAYDQRRGECNLMGFVGTELKKVFDYFTVRVDAGSSNETYPVRTFTASQDSKKVLACVDILEFSTGKVSLHLSSYLQRTPTTGGVTDFSTRSGLFLDMSMWSLAYQDAPALYDLENQGGGPRGYADCIMGLKSYNPLGQVVVSTDTD
ncbi:MAG: DUF5309 domain-containing protein [Nitrosopumilus sp.]|nr:DUF5309 domain-containing protein [Nitrosopumilus sp.]